MERNPRAHAAHIEAEEKSAERNRRLLERRKEKGDAPGTEMPTSVPGHARRGAKPGLA